MMMMTITMIPLVPVLSQEWIVMTRTVMTTRMRKMTMMVTVTLRNQRQTLKQSIKMVTAPRG